MSSNFPMNQLVSQSVSRSVPNRFRNMRNGPAAVRNTLSTDRWSKCLFTVNSTKYFQLRVSMLCNSLMWAISLLLTHLSLSSLFVWPNQHSLRADQFNFPDCVRSQILSIDDSSSPAIIIHSHWRKLNGILMKIASDRMTTIFKCKRVENEWSDIDKVWGLHHLLIDRIEAIHGAVMQQMINISSIESRESCLFSLFVRLRLLEFRIGDDAPSIQQ